MQEYRDDTLIMIDFDEEKISFDMRYEDKDAVEEMRSSGGSPVPLPKIGRLYGDMCFPAPPAGRPYTYSSIVLSSDGKMAFTDEPAGPVIAKNNYLDPDGALTDFWLLNALRANAEGQHFHSAIATSPAGGAYLGRKFRKEHFYIGPYDTPPPAEELKNIRKQLKDGRGVPVFLTGAVDVPDAEILLYLLRHTGHEYLSVESPSYAAHLIQKEALDEMFINYSLVFAGGPVTPNAANAFSSTRHPHAALRALAFHDRHFMFTRQRIVYGVDGPAQSGTAVSKMKY